MLKYKTVRVNTNPFVKLHLPSSLSGTTKSSAKLILLGEVLKKAKFYSINYKFFGKNRRIFIKKAHQNS